MPTEPIRSILIAHRSEIAIRVMRAAAEMRIRTVAIYSQQDRQALHRFKADESCLVSGASFWGLSADPTGRIGAANSGPRMSVQGRNRNLVDSKTGHSDSVRPVP